MKKFTKILALSLALIMSVMMFASCGLFSAKPASDPDDAVEALEDNDYTVMLVDTKALLEAAAPSFNATSGLDFELDADDLDAMLTAYDDDENMIVIFYFKDKDSVNDLYEALKESQEDAEKELKDEKDDMDEDEYKEAKEELDNAVVGKSGKMVWVGTKDAVKAAK